MALTAFTVAGGKVLEDLSLANAEHYDSTYSSQRVASPLMVLW